MMPTRRSPLLVRAGSAAILVLALAGCTPGGQFDPTSLLANDMFDTKTKLKGDRQPVFPNGVPGATSGVPQDLVKGYQPSPDQAAAASAPDAAAEEAAKNKPKPKPKVARAPAQPPASPPRRINIGASPNPTAPAAPPSAAPSQPGSPQQSQQSPWPAPAQPAPAQQAEPTVQSRWPDPPKSGTSSQ
jgi:hypothetical protein